MLPWVGGFVQVRRVACNHGTRVERDVFDVLALDSTRIEVKSSAYLQVWEQRELSKIRFSGLRGRTWDRNGVADDITYNADVYVFCVQTAMNHDSYDPLNVDQWRFYVLPRRSVEGTGYASISLKAIEKLTSAVEYEGLRQRIREASGE